MYIVFSSFAIDGIYVTQPTSVWMPVEVCQRLMNDSKTMKTRPNA